MLEWFGSFRRIAHDSYKFIQRTKNETQTTQNHKEKLDADSHLSKPIFSPRVFDLCYHGDGIHTWL